MHSARWRCRDIVWFAARESAFNGAINTLDANEAWKQVPAADQDKIKDAAGQRKLLCRFIAALIAANLARLGTRNRF